MGILTFGVLSEQIKTRIEQADEAKSTQVQLLINVVHSAPLSSYAEALLSLEYTSSEYTSQQPLSDCFDDRWCQTARRWCCQVASSTRMSRLAVAPNHRKAT